MAYSHAPSDSFEGEKGFDISPTQLSGASPLTNVFNPSGYEHLDLEDGDEVSVRGGANARSPSPDDSINSLGIFPDQKATTASVRRVSRIDRSRRVTSASEAVSPGSTKHLLDSPASSNARSPGNIWTTPKTAGIFERLTPKRASEETASLRQNATPFSYSPAPNTPMGIPNDGPSPDAEPGKEDSETEAFNKRFSAPPSYCKSKKDIWKGRINQVMMASAVYPLIVGGFLFGVSIYQPALSLVGKKHGLEASTAGTLVSLAAKTVEVTFAGAFLFCLGQALSRRSVSRMTLGVTLSEMDMRNWLYAPGTMILQFRSAWFSIRSLLGVLTFVATIGVLLYTTAINTMVSPKLKLMPSQDTMLQGEFYTSYGNMDYGVKKCPVLFGKDKPSEDDAWGCTSVEFCGQSYTDLLGYMQSWTDFQSIALSQPLQNRPAPSSLLNGNKTMQTSWIETEHRNVTANFEKYGRIIDNVTMAMPHPGVLRAAELPRNKIPRLQDGFIGDVTIHAGVVSPSLNVMCVNMKKEELAPLVYTAWPNSRKVPSSYPGLTVPVGNWSIDAPPWGEDGKKGSTPNKTAVDDIFKWGAKYGRTPPMIAAYPPPLNVVSNMTVNRGAAVYILAKHPDIADYTLCEARSWVSTACLTKVLISGTHGASLSSTCEKTTDDNTAYDRASLASKEPPRPDVDWPDIAKNWSTSMDMNGGLHVSNASNGRILSQLILRENKLDHFFPSIAEALSAYMASTVVMAAIDSPFDQGWKYPTKILDEPGSQEFFARVQTQQYAAGHTQDWQKVWYSILFIVPALSLCCVLYMALSGGVVTDFTEPKTLFTLALNSPPSVQIHGSCGGGPKGRDLVVPWRVSYEPELQHYYFEEANNRPWRGKYARQEFRTPGQGADGVGANYNRLSASRLKL